MGNGTERATTTDGVRAVPVTMGMGVGQNAFSVLEAASLAPLVEGVHRFSARRYLSGERALAEVLPEGFVVDRSCCATHLDSFYCRAEDGGSAMLVDIRRGGAAIFVTAASESLLEEQLHRLEAIERTTRRRRERLVWFWRLDPTGEARSMARPLRAARWAEVACNYPEPGRSALGELMSLRRPRGSGRLLVWSGPAGTGKTSAVRTLARQWAAWCDVHVVSDPERLFGSSDYLLDLVTAAPHVVPARRAQRRWKLLVAEDADEQLAAPDGRPVSPAFSRLLNVTDGLVADGLDVLVLLTSNQRVRKLHPALTRPGRCLAVIEFGVFSPDEASRWLGEPIHGSVSLAELYERQRDRPRIETPGPRLATGAYL